MTIEELSIKMYLAFSTITNFVNRMEKNELVMQIRDEEGRRIIHIHLLKEGNRIIKEMLGKSQNYLNELLVDFEKRKLSYSQYYYINCIYK